MHDLEGWRRDLVAKRVETRLSLEGIAEKTKLGVRFLRAIEEGRFEELPGGIYRRSYLRQYAEAVGMDRQVVDRVVSTLPLQDDHDLLGQMVRSKS